ncbi:MAG: AAA family ATPase [Actinobacteria bacterium]|nr:AAA family ATPase [Actinomycetota bacterium]MBI3687421.1 AAA family ATPase [Actinomycetota bacterium]
MIVQLAGLPGTGKSTLAAALAHHLSRVTVWDKDQVRHTLFGAQGTLYTRAQDDECVQIMLNAAARRLAHNPSTLVVLDGRTCSRAYQVEQIRTFAHRLGQPLRLIECVCDDDLALARLAADHTRGIHRAANRTPELYQRLSAFADPIPEPKLLIDTGNPISDYLGHVLDYVAATALVAEDFDTTSPATRERR